MAALFLCSAIPTFGSSNLLVDIKDGETLSIKKLDLEADIKVDGHLDEPLWQSLPAYDEFIVTTPETLGEVPHATLVRLAYSDQGFYVGVDLKQSKETLMKRLSGRDQRDITRDTVSVTLDTSGEGRYGYWFSVSLGDSLQDGTVLPERKFTSDWDGAWLALASKLILDGPRSFLFPGAPYRCQPVAKNKML